MKFSSPPWQHNAAPINNNIFLSLKASGDFMNRCWCDIDKRTTTTHIKYKSSGVEARLLRNQSLIKSVVQWVDPL